MATYNPARGLRPAPIIRRGSYGLDAPRLLIVPGVCFLFGVVQGLLAASVWPFVGAAAIVACSSLGLYASRRGKFVVWAGLIAELGLRGDEAVLDIGCGRGAVLLLAAEHLSAGKPGRSGRAVGIDLWRGGDQSGNAKEATDRNAEAEGVADRVEVVAADMTDLPFADGDFDIVLSSIAIHNVHGAAVRHGDRRGGPGAAPGRLRDDRRFPQDRRVPAVLGCPGHDRCRPAPPRMADVVERALAGDDGRHRHQAQVAAFSR